MNLQEAASALGVHYQTAYRWVRDGRLSAVKVDSAYVVEEQEVLRVLDQRRTPSAPPARSNVRNWPAQVTRLVDALLDGDEVQAWAVLDRLAEGGVPVVEMCEKLLSPALATIGYRWHEGTVSIGVEHRSTAIVERILARIGTHPRGRPRGTCVVTGAPGDQHPLPSSMAAMALREDRWRVHHLGIDLPADAVVDMAAQVDASLVVISTVWDTDNEAVTGLAHRLEHDGRRVMVGGPGKSLSAMVASARSTTNAALSEFAAAIRVPVRA